MQIVIPMSGFGERFRRAGYTVPKPLIEIDGKPIVAHVIDMFPGESDFIFICNEDHLAEASYQMEAILKKYCPTGRVVGIPAHKLGPVHAVRQVASMIKSDEPVVVNYCDFTCYWDWQHFCKFAKESKSAGIIPAYKGFHPHTLGTTNYAYMREKNGRILDIQEKQPYTNNRMEEYASSGTYYFSSGRIMLDAFQDTMERDLNVNGEFYVSLTYKPLLDAQQPVAVYALQHFMQWGTPADVREYQRWSDTFKRLAESAPKKMSFAGTVIVPMAGMGERFTREGYTTTKPLIEISGKPMVIQATDDLPPASQYVFVLRTDMPGFEGIQQTLLAAYPNVVIETVSQVTEGQACTAQLGLAAVSAHTNNDVPTPITFGACDYGALYDSTALHKLFEDSNTDVIVWAVRGHANAIRHPQMFGWIDVHDDVIQGISVKTALSSPESDPIVLGTFTFKKADDFLKCVEHLIARNGRINGEFYLDSCINDALTLGLKCKIFEVDYLLSWGTPNDLRTFEYWQSCFHKWAGHPYRLEQDCRIPAQQVPYLNTKYNQFQAISPGENGC